MITHIVLFSFLLLSRVFVQPHLLDRLRRLTKLFLQCFCADIFCPRASQLQVQNVFSAPPCDHAAASNSV